MKEFKPVRYRPPFVQVTSRTELHLARKLYHSLFGSALVLLYSFSNFSQYSWGVGLVFLGVLALAFDLIRLQNPKINDFVLRRMKSVIRTQEVHRVSGNSYFLIGCGISIFLFPFHISVLSMLFLVFGDPLISTIGVKWGKTKILPTKSLEGTLAGALICFMLCLFYCLTFGVQDVSFFSILVFSVVSGIVGSFSELCSVIIDDNFTIPVISGLWLSVLNIFFGVLP